MDGLQPPTWADLHSESKHHGPRGLRRPIEPRGPDRFTALLLVDDNLGSTRDDIVQLQEVTKLFGLRDHKGVGLGHVALVPKFCETCPWDVLLLVEKDLVTFLRSKVDGTVQDSKVG